jgi:hypothetical protein
MRKRANIQNITFRKAPKNTPYRKEVREPGSPQSFSPPLLSRIWTTLNEVPLAFLSMLALFAGAVILRLYFQQIGFMPTEVGALLTLFSAAAVIFLVLFLLSGAVLLYPALIARYVGMALPIRDYAVLVAELTLLTALLAWAWLDAAWTCSTGISVAAYVFTTIFLILLCCNLYYGWLHWKAASGTRWRRAGDLGKYVAVMASIGLVTIFPLIMLQTPERAWTSWVESKPELLPLGDTGILLMWMSVLLLNAICAKLRGRGSSFMFAMLILFAAGAYLIWLPNVFGRESRFPEMVATQLGLRLEGTSNLLVQEKSCEILLASLSLGVKSEIPKCKSGVNQVEAEVPARIGSTWLVGPQRINGVEISKAEMSRVTLADADVRLILKKPPVKPGVKKAPSCAQGA